MEEIQKYFFRSIFHILSVTHLFLIFYVSVGYYNIFLVIVVALASGDVVFPHIFV